MTKNELVKIIIDLEYTEEQKTDRIIKIRTADLMRYRKSFLIERVAHLNK